MYALTRRLDKPDWALVYRRLGAGDIFACQVPLAARIDRSHPDPATARRASGADFAVTSDFDPVAERLFAFLIEGDPLPEDEPAK